MSQEVSKWLVKWVSSPTYKWGILGIITPTDPPITFNLCRTNRHPTKGRVVRVATAPKTNEGHVAFRGSKIPKGLSPQFCQAKGDFSNKHQNGFSPATKPALCKAPKEIAKNMGTSPRSHLWKSLRLCIQSSKVRKISWNSDADVLVEESHKFIVWCPWFSFWWIVGLSLIGCGATYPQQRHSINSCSRLVPQIYAKIVPQVCGTATFCKGSLHFDAFEDDWPDFKWMMWFQIGFYSIKTLSDETCLRTKKSAVFSDSWVGFEWLILIDFFPRETPEKSVVFYFRALAPRLFFTQSHGFVDWVGGGLVGFQCFLGDF